MYLKKEGMIVSYAAERPSNMRTELDLTNWGVLYDPHIVSGEWW